MNMKKILAIALALCMMLTSFAAVAESAELNWASVEPQIAEAGWQGDFVTFDEIAVKVWVPAALTAVELTDEDRENGYIGYFTNEDQSATMSVMYVDMGGMDLETYSQQVAEVGATDIGIGTINGQPTLSYVLPDADVGCVAFTTEAGYILEFGFNPISDESFMGVASVMMASIQAN